jgi:excisionase family DNA binding protein
MDTTPPKSDLMTIAEAMKYLRISRQTLYERTKAREIPSYKIGRKVLYKRQELDLYLEKQRQQ